MTETPFIERDGVLCNDKNTLNAQACRLLRMTSFLTMGRDRDEHDSDGFG